MFSHFCLFFPNFIPLILQPPFTHKKDRLFQSHCYTQRSDLNSVFLLFCAVFPAWLIYSTMNMEAADSSGWIILVLLPGSGKIFPFSKMSRPALGPTQPPIQWVPRIPSVGGGGGKAVGAWGDHSLSSSAEVKNWWSYTSTHLVCLCGMCSNNFAFTLLFVNPQVCSLQASLCYDLLLTYRWTSKNSQNQSKCEQELGTNYWTQYDGVL